MEDIKLDKSDKLKLIEKIVNDDGLYALNEYLQSLMPSKKVETEETSFIEDIPTEVPKEDISSPKEASIYRKEAIPLVQQDMIDHPVEQIVEPIVTEEHSGPVKKLVNNPWSTAEGIKTVSPGELNLK